VSQLLVAIRAELQHAELERAKEMEPKLNKLIVLVPSNLTFASTLIIPPCTGSLLRKIDDAVKKRKGIERDSDSPSPTSTGACDRISGWLCNTAIDVRRLAADSEEVAALQTELREVVQEFNVSDLRLR
jgi:hypothetical protein